MSGIFREGTPPPSSPDPEEHRGDPSVCPSGPSCPMPPPPQPASSQPWRWGSRTPPPRPTSPPPQDPPLSKGPPHTPRGPRCVSPCYPQGDPNVWDSHPASPGDTRHPPTLQRDPPDPPFSPGPRCPPPLFPNGTQTSGTHILPLFPDTPRPIHLFPKGPSPPATPKGHPGGGVVCVCVPPPPSPPWCTGCQRSRCRDRAPCRSWPCSPWARGSTSTADPYGNRCTVAARSSSSPPSWGGGGKWVSVGVPNPHQGGIWGTLRVTSPPWEVCAGKTWVSPALLRGALGVSRDAWGDPVVPGGPQPSPGGTWVSQGSPALFRDDLGVFGGSPGVSRVSWVSLVDPSPLLGGTWVSLRAPGPLWGWIWTSLGVSSPHWADPNI